MDYLGVPDVIIRVLIKERPEGQRRRGRSRGQNDATKNQGMQAAFRSWEITP